MMTARFEGGKNIAMKVPAHQHDATVAFYKDTLGLEEISSPTGQDIGFKFGPMNLWIDKKNGLSQAELWLEIVTDNTPEAAAALNEGGAIRCDEIEPLGEGFDGFWISSPASVIHLVIAKDDSRD
jgi:catechol 2,3-dioxygenase-like lactoylglutathione lyase family enzyme